MTARGHFTKNDPDNTFVLTDPQTPRKWQLYLCSEEMLVQLDQFGLGMSRYWNAKGEDVILMDEPERTVAIRKPDGSVWSPAVFPGLEAPRDYRCEYNPAWWRTSGRDEACAVSWQIAVPEHEPVEMWSVTLRNLSDKPVERDVFTFLPSKLTGYCLSKYRFYMATTMFIRALHQPEANAVWIKNGIPELPHERFNSFLACSTAPDSFDTARDAFLGLSNSVYNAKAIRAGRCSNSLGYFGEVCLAMHHHVVLAQGECRELHFLTGPTTGPEETQRLYDALCSGEAMARETDKVAATRRREQGRATVQTGVESLDRLANTWAKSQNRLGVLHRKGFRDVLQDSTGMALYDAARAREGIEEVVSVQRADGAGIRAWKPYIDAAEYSDGPYWIPLAVGSYIRETGDTSLLDKELPYHESTNREPVWEHLVKGVTYLYHDRNERGLCRMRFADWNDGLDGVGHRGRGDSTMVTFGLAAALSELRALSALTNRSLPFDTDAWRAELAMAVEKQAWTGDYYIRGYRDDGQPYGSPENEFGQIYLNAQAWAVLSTLAPRERWRPILNLAIERLATPRGLRLFMPCYPGFDPYLGRVSAELPGVYENGAMYNHGACFFLHALLEAGDVENAWRYLEMMLPDSAANPSDRSGAEPFVLTNCIFGEEAERRAGTSYFGWYTGSAAWVLRLIHNGFSGLRPEFDGLHVRPDRIPAAIKLKSVGRHFRGTDYRVLMDPALESGILIDGVPGDQARALPLKTGGRVEVRLPSV